MHEKGKSFVDLLIGRGLDQVSDAYLHPKSREYILPILKDSGMDNLQRWRKPNEPAVDVCVRLLESFLSSNK
jgi:hypothetical protein